MDVFPARRALSGLDIVKELERGNNGSLTLESSFARHVKAVEFESG